MRKHLDLTDEYPNLRVEKGLSRREVKVIGPGLK
jgi:hypothetical protein